MLPGALVFKREIWALVCWSFRPSIKKSLFPVQRVAVIVASWAAAIFFPPILFLVGKFCPLLEEIFFFFAKMKTKVPSQPFFRHPAAPPETDRQPGAGTTSGGAGKIWEPPGEMGSNHFSPSLKYLN